MGKMVKFTTLKTKHMEAILKIGDKSFEVRIINPIDVEKLEPTIKTKHYKMRSKQAHFLFYECSETNRKVNTDSFKGENLPTKYETITFNVEFIGSGDTALIPTSEIEYRISKALQNEFNQQK